MRLDNKLIRYFLATVIFGVSIYLSARRISLVDFVRDIQNLNYFWIFASVPIIIISNHIRALRWKMILDPISNEVKTFNAFSAIMIGHLLNSFTLKFGEIARPIILAKREKLSVAAVFSTALLEAGLDFVFLIILLLLTLGFLSEQILELLNFNYSNDSILSILLLVILSSVTLGFTYFYRNIIWLKTKRILPTKLTDIIENSIQSFKHGFSALKNPGFYIKMLFLTIVLWLSYALAMYVIFFAFPFQSSIFLTYWDAILIVTFAGIATAIGFTPGAVGVYHFMVATILTTIYSLTSIEAFAYATVIHFVNIIVQSSIGAVFYVIEGVKSIKFNGFKNSDSNM